MSRSTCALLCPESTITSLHHSAIRSHNRLSLSSGREGKTFSEPSAEPEQVGSRLVQSVIIDGREVKVNPTKNTDSRRSATRMWDKTARASLSDEARILFNKHSVGYCLDKSNKLALPPSDATDELQLELVRNLKSQL